MDNDLDRWLDALEGSHRALVSLVGPLDGAALRSPSYCTGWNVAGVLSHLGSGAQIFEMILDAVLAGDPPPPAEHFPPVWDRWNAMSPEEQANGFLWADGRVVSSLRQAADRLADMHVTLFGRMTVDGAGLVGMRLNEHALHSWDVAVAFDPAAKLRSDAVGLLLDRLPMAGFAGHPEGADATRPFSSLVASTDSARAFSIEVADEVRITEEAASNGADLHLPAEATLRLVYGRLDDDHGPPVDADELAALDRLRRVFTGF